MAKYFYVYNIAGVEDSIVKMFNTDTGAMGEKSVKKDRMDTLLQEVASRVRDIPKLFYNWAENFCWKARKNGYLQ